MDKKLILSEIKSYYGFKSEAEFARFLEISSNTLFNWYSRNTMDYERIVTKCDEIDANWIFSGKGNMLKKALKSNDDESNNENMLNITKINVENHIEWKDKYFSLLEKYNALLEDKLKTWIDKQV